MEERPKTYLIDIDGTLLKHSGDITNLHTKFPAVLPGVLDKLRELDRKSCKIILISGRREGTRKQTEEQLASAGIIYDQLILGAGNGIRVLVNDCKPNSAEATAIAINLERNKGLEGIEF